MIVYQTDNGGRYVGQIELNESDKDPKSGKYLIPGGCVVSEPPIIPTGQEAFLRDGEWILHQISVEPEFESSSQSNRPSAVSPTHEQRLITLELAILEMAGEIYG